MDDIFLEKLLEKRVFGKSLIVIIIDITPLIKIKFFIKNNIINAGV